LGGKDVEDPHTGRVAQGPEQFRRGHGFVIAETGVGDGRATRDGRGGLEDGNRLAHGQILTDIDISWQPAGERTSMNVDISLTTPEGGAHAVRQRALLPARLLLIGSASGGAGHSSGRP
jgi:hypothetical protein